MSDHNKYVAMSFIIALVFCSFDFTTSKKLTIKMDAIVLKIANLISRFVFPPILRMIDNTKPLND